MSNYSVNREESFALLYKSAKQIYEKDVNLCKTCLLGALYGKFIELGLIEPNFKGDSPDNFMFLEQLILKLDWGKIKNSVNLSRLSQGEKASVKSALCMLSNCYKMIYSTPGKKRAYRTELITLTDSALQFFS